jgi:hypothetical protein
MYPRKAVLAHGLALSIGVGLAACGAESDPLQDAHDAVTGSTWTISAFTRDDGAGGEEDVWASWSDCTRSNALAFSDDGTFSLTGGGTTDCPTEISEGGAWQLVGGPTTLITDRLLHNGEAVGFDLYYLGVSINDASMQLETDRPDGVSGKMYLTFAAR